ncbi:MAG: putative DNA binding domain-containing protein [Treponema sp.]|nr:putative DNA binding domain-containing protein [Treponema sp.]
MALNVNLAEIDENLTTEFKREYTEDIKKTIIAFANTAGGTIYIGVNDDKTVAGVDAPDDTLLQVTNVIRLSIKPDLTLFVDCKTEKVGKDTIIVIIVQKGTACPYYLAGKGIRPEGVYVRQGASTVPASETAILKMIKETDGEKYEEVRSLNQDLTFTVTENIFTKENISFGSNQQKTLHLQTVDGVYTNLGLLLSDQSVHTVKLAVFEGLEKEIFKDRREFSGSLLKQLWDVYEYLDIHNRTHAHVEGLLRTDYRDYPEDALREALLNALVHRDYSYSSSILISVFDDRIEFVSVGGLPKGVSLDDVLLGVSVLRNEKLANVFYRLHLIEAYGTGIPKIMRSYNDNIRKPELQATSNAFKIILPNRNINTHEVFINKDLFIDNEKKILLMLEKKGGITRKDIESALLISQAKAVRILRSLQDKGIIKSIGEGKNIRYEKISAR